MRALLAHPENRSETVNLAPGDLVEVVAPRGHVITDWKNTKPGAQGVVVSLVYEIPGTVGFNLWCKTCCDVRFAAGTFKMATLCLRKIEPAPREEYVDDELCVE